MFFRIFNGFIFFKTWLPFQSVTSVCYCLQIASQKRRKNASNSNVNYIRIKMSLEDMENVLSQCIFCAKMEDESELIEISANLIKIEDSIIEFEDLISIVLNAKVNIN